VIPRDHPKLGRPSCPLLRGVKSERVRTPPAPFPETPEAIGTVQNPPGGPELGQKVEIPPPPPAPGPYGQEARAEWEHENPGPTWTIGSVRKLERPPTGLPRRHRILRFRRSGGPGRNGPRPGVLGFDSETRRPRELTEGFPGLNTCPRRAPEGLHVQPATPCPARAIEWAGPRSGP